MAANARVRHLGSTAVCAVLAMVRVDPAGAQCPAYDDVVPIFDPAAASNGRFGSGLAADGDRILISAPGAARAYLLDAGSLAVISVFNGAKLEVGFGFSVALAGGDLAIASYGAFTPPAVYLFDAETGELQHTLFPPTGMAGDGDFGFDLAIADSQIMISDPYVDEDGAAYVFDLESGGLVHTFYEPGTSLGDYNDFGWAVAAYQDQWLVGNPSFSSSMFTFLAGKVSAFDRQTGAFEGGYFNPNPFFGGFGAEIAASGDALLIQRSFGPDPLVYLSVNGLLQYTFQSPMPPPAAAGFGAAVGFAAENVVISDTQGANVVHLFELGGPLCQTFANPTPALDDGFGARVATLGHDLIVAAPNDDTMANNAGAVYVFRAQSVALVTANPPAVSPYGPGVFRDVLQNATASLVPQGIGVPGTPSEGPYQLSAIEVTFSDAPAPAPSPGNVSVSCTGPALECPSVAGVSGAGVGPYLITLSAPIPAGHCATLTFSGTAATLAIQYQSQPGDVNLDSMTNTQDLLALIRAMNNGEANQPQNLARYNIDRSHDMADPVNVQDLLRLVHLLNGIQSTQPFNGTVVAACP